MPADIQQFFDAYRDAFNRLDGREVSAFYQVPSMISQSSNEGLFVDAETLIANNEALCAMYRDSGFVRTEYVENASIAQGDHFFVADLAWTIHRNNQAPQRFNTTYQLVRRGDAAAAWKIEHVTAYSEQRFWKNDE